MIAKRPPRRYPDELGYARSVMSPAPRRRPRLLGPLAIAALSICVAFAGGFHPAINLTVAALGGITAAVMLYKELS